jgi:hypothetical protein
MNPLSGVLSEAWGMYKTFAKHLLAIAFVIYLAAAIITALFALAGSIGYVFGFFVLFVANFVLQATLVKAVQDVRDGRVDMSISETVSAAAPSLWSVVAASILASIGIWIGFWLLIVPGLFLITIWAVIVPVIMVERSGALASFGRSRELVRGHGWHVFATLVLLDVILFVVAAVLGVIFKALPFALDNGLSAVIAGTLVSPFIAIVVTLVYYRLVGSSASAGPGDPWAYQQQQPPANYGGFTEPPQSSGQSGGGWNQPTWGGETTQQPSANYGGFTESPQGGSEPPTQQVPRWDDPQQPR